MLLQLPAYAVFIVLSFSSLASTSIAGHARLHRHSHPARRLEAKIDSRSDSTSVQVPLSELQLLRTETASFQQWMTSWINSESLTDRESSVALLQQEINAYQGWMTAWLHAIDLPNIPSSIPLPSKIPVTLPAGSSLELSTLPALPTSTSPPFTKITQPPTSAAETSEATLSTSQAINQTSTTQNSQAALLTSSTSKPVSSSAVVSAGEFFQKNPPQNQPNSITLPTPASSQVSFITSVVPEPSNAQTSGASPGGPGLSSGFDAQSSQNLVVYYGQSGATSQFSLADVCSNENVDIVVLAFLTEFFGPGGFPTLNFGPACGGQTPEMKAAGATGLLSCPDMASQITQCQSLGKKVLLSLGGSVATTAFSSDSQAAQFANQLWDLFGSGTGVDPGLRPFGQTKIDGFDVDNEDHSTASYSAFVSSLRSNTRKDSSRTYYISAAPQCPRPDASIPLDAMQTMDFVFVQFYNNAAANCDIGQPGFLDSLKAWSSDLSAQGAGPKLYVGAPGCSDCAGAGYLDATEITSAISGIKAAGISNFGGIMLWDGSEAMLNQNGGVDFTATVKSALK